MTNEGFASEVVTHPVTHEMYQRSRTGSRRVVQIGSGGNVRSLGIDPNNFPIPFFHSEIARDLGIEELVIQTRRLVQMVIGK